MIVVGVNVANVYFNYKCVTRFYILCWPATVNAACPSHVPVTDGLVAREDTSGNA